jgi:hypothetical protein
MMTRLELIRRRRQMHRRIREVVADRRLATSLVAAQPVPEPEGRPSGEPHD